MVQPRSVACDRGGKTVPRIRDERCSPKPSALIRIGAANSPSLDHDREIATDLAYATPPITRLGGGPCHSKAD
jgi:hypothetical protein